MNYQDDIIVLRNLLNQIIDGMTEEEGKDLREDSHGLRESTIIQAMHDFERKEECDNFKHVVSKFDDEDCGDLSEKSLQKNPWDPR